MLCWGRAPTVGPLTDSRGNLVESSEGTTELFNEESLNDIPEAKWAFSGKGGTG